MTAMNREEIESLQRQIVAEIAGASDGSTLEAARVKYLGRKGVVTALMSSLKEAAPAERPELGRLLNALKQAVQDALDTRRKQLDNVSSAASESFDFTLPGEWREIGMAHPIHALIERATEIFRSIGFTVADGPDIETVRNNFDALNTPEDHPSRDPSDTFYLENGDLLRCQTSPVQVRYMEAHPPPVRIIAPGRCYRRDTPDATHSANFHQIEGLYVDRQVSLADLKGDLTYFARQLFGPGVRIRFRPHFFPFTEPSVEVDASCHVCGGQGCRVCKESGWIEIAGAGMVHPNVFRAVGYERHQVVGYAFGMGIERMAMILFGVPDIRLLYENDLRYLRQFASGV